MKPYVAGLPAFVIAAALVAPACGAAQAQESSSAEAIVVTAQAENASAIINGGNAGVLGNRPAEDLPFSIRSYDESLILNQQPLTLGDVLENDPTIRTTYGFGNAAEQFVIRGFPLFGDDLGLNGLYGIAPRQLVAPELFDSVQVLNGATAFLNGASPGGSGLGGSVNLLLKRAGQQPLTRATVGLNGQSHVGGSFDVARRFGPGSEWGLRINGAWREGEVAVEDEDRRTQVLGGALDYDGGALRASLDIAYQDIRVDHLRPKVTLLDDALPAVPDAAYNYAQRYTYTSLRDIFGVARLEYDLTKDVMVYAKAGVRDGDEEGIYGGIQVTDAATGEATSGSHSFIPFNSDNSAIEGGIRARLATGPLTHEINVGGNMIWQEERTAYDFRAAFATNLYNVAQVPLQPTAFAGGDLDDPFPITKRRLKSVFFSDTIGLWSDRVLLTGGLRWQQIGVDGFSYSGGALDTSYEEDAWTPVVGLVVKPTGGLSLYANWIEALQQGPSAPLEEAELVNRGEPLAPRRSTQFEIGGKVALGQMFAGLALYQTERPGEGTFTNELGELEYGYLGDQRHRGIEITLNGEVAPGLRLISGLALSEAELVGGNEVAGVPGFTANADVEWDLPMVPGLTLTGRLLHTGEQWVNTANTLELDPWTTLDLGARYVVAFGAVPVTLRVSVDNVTGERYWASAFDTFNTALLQGQPRTGRISISADF